jgi:hypothetical protein
LPDGIDPTQNGFGISPNREYAIHFDRTGSNKAAGVTKSKLVVTPLVGDGKPFALEGFVVMGRLFSADGSKLYLYGGKGDKLDVDQVKVATHFVLNLHTKKLEQIDLPEKHRLQAVAPDGNTFITSRIEADNNSYSQKNYLVVAGRKPVEVYKENVFPVQLTFSPDGSKVLTRWIEYINVRPNGKGGFDIDGVKPVQYVVLDVDTKKTQPLKNMPADEYLSGWAWSPDGSRFAYVHYNGANVPVVPAPGGGAIPRREYEYKVFVADADGENPKVVYKTKGTGFRAFMWH